MLANARRGHAAAFAALIERHDPLLRRLAHNLLDGEGTDAALVDAYVKAYRSLGRSRGEALPWLARTTYLSCVDRLRRRERRRRGGPGRKPVPTEAPADEYPLAGLPPDQQAVVVLVDGCHLTQDLVAETLRVPVPTVTGLLARGREQVTDGPSSVAEAPAPEPDFWRALGTKLLAERAAPAAPVPRMPDADQSTPSQRRAKAPPLAMQRRAPRRRRFRPEDSSPDPVEGLAVEARRRRPRLSTRARVVVVRSLVVLLALGAVGGAVFALVSVASRAKSPVRDDSVAEISRRSAAALATLENYSATVTRTSIEGGRRRVQRDRIVRNRAGSYAITGTGVATSYDAPSDTLRRAPRSAGEGPGGEVGALETGLAAGPPDPSGTDAALPDVDVNRALRTLSGIGDRAAVARRVDGVDSWLMQGPVPSEARTGGIDGVTLAVSRATLTPVRVSFTAQGRVTRSLAFSDVALGGLVPATFEVDPGPAARLTDHGFRTVALDAVAEAVGREPLRPVFLPAGFELAAVTVRTEGATASLRYQRGFDRVVVTTRTSPVGRGAAWADPFDRGATAVSPEPVALDEGPFRQTTAQRVDTVGALPSLWGSDGIIAFTVAGDLTGDQLVEVAESLRA